MKCDLCGVREAVVFVHQVGREGTTEVRLCAQCAKDHGVNNLDGDVTAAVGKLLSALPKPSAAGTATEIVFGPCPHCGAELTEVRKRGSASCAVCWRHFGAALETGGQRHGGRLSLRLDRLRARDRVLVALRENLQRALDLEDYEQAAALRDELRRRETPGADLD